MSRRLLAPAVFGAGLAAPGAADASPSARLVYSRTSDAAVCPEESVLRKAVAARFGYDPFFQWAQTTVVVHVSRDRGVYTARVQIIDPRGLVRGTRELMSGESECSELFDATALAISIALDAADSMTRDIPQAEPTPAPTPTTPPNARAEALLPPTAASSPADTATTSGGSAFGRRPASGASLAQPPTPTSDSTRPKPRSGPVGGASGARPVPTGSGWAIGISAVGAAGVAPAPAPGLQAFIEIRPRSIAPALSIGAEPFGYLSSTSEVGDGGSVRIALAGASVVPCLRGPKFFGCGVAQLGWAQAWRPDLPSPPSQGALHVAVGARLGVDLALSDSLFARLHADVMVNPRRFILELDYGESWTAWPILGMLGVGIGTQFP